MMLRIDGHSVVVAAARYWVSSHHVICCRVDLGDFVGISQVHVYLARDGVILGQQPINTRAAKRARQNACLLIRFVETFRCHLLHYLQWALTSSSYSLS